jgi:hypothetical protein
MKTSHIAPKMLKLELLYLMMLLLIAILHLAKMIVLLTKIHQEMVYPNYLLFSVEFSLHNLTANVNSSDQKATSLWLPSLQSALELISIVTTAKELNPVSSLLLVAPKHLQVLLAAVECYI